MTNITIREQQAKADGSFSATLVFDHAEEFDISIRDPFAAPEEAESEARLEWYFEHWLEFPFTDAVKAQAAAESITQYGVALFHQIFADPEAFAHYRECTQNGVESLSWEIAGSPAFHELHWEALRDPKLPRPFAVDAPMARLNRTPQIVRANVRESPTVNLLVLVARPFGAHDVGYRTIARPLVETLRQAPTPVQIEFVRPGTYRALSDYLQSKPAGYYHAIHFDVHGSLMSFEQYQKAEADVKTNRLTYQTRYGRDDIPAYEGHKAFLFLEDEQNKPDPLEASELAALLQTHQIPIVILNACQSGKQVGDRETSLGSRLMQAGVQVALAMSYSVTVSAAKLTMQTLYPQLFARHDLAEAIRRARRELYDDKRRTAYFSQTIDLEDWLLPVVYQNHAVSLRPRAFTPDENRAFYEERAHQFAFPQTEYGFFGRDLDILNVERRVLGQSNLLLIHGMGGAGKTTLLRHLAAWWQTTSLVERVFYFGYDQQAWTLQQMLAEIARALFGEARYHAEFVPLSPAAQQTKLADELRAHRHLLILDNLESITGAHLAIQHTLPLTERNALRDWLAQLRDGRTLVLLGSRGGEEWLREGNQAGAPLREDDVYDLGGLDGEAATALAEKILERHHATQYRTDDDFATLLRVLAGYPLALQVVLPNLEKQTPKEILNALFAGDEHLDLRRADQDKTTSILQCVEYSHGNLDPALQELLLCLAPFVGVMNTEWLPQYAERLRAQPALAHLQFERWEEAIKAASDWGLVTPHLEARGYLQLQPTLPFFLLNRLNVPEQDERKCAIEAAFRELYDAIGGALAEAMESKQPDERRVGQALTNLEYENLRRALDLALSAQVSIANPYAALSLYLQARQDHARGLALGQMTLAGMDRYPQASLQVQLGAEFVGVIDHIGRLYLFQNQYAEAEGAYQRALNIWLDNKHFPADQIKKRSAPIYHQLGMVAEKQRKWAQAERYYQQALQIKIEFNDRYSQASTYHQLGMVAQEQRQWAHAERYYQQALQIKIEFNDRYSQASTYHQLGRVAEDQRQWAQADHYYQQSLQIKIEFNDRYSQASTYHQLGMVAEEQRQWAQAERYFHQALQILIEFDGRYEQGVTYHQLGSVAEYQRQWPQARNYFLRALEIGVEFKDEYRVGTRLQSLARLQKESGDETLAPAVAKVLGVSEEEARRKLEESLKESDEQSSS